MSFEKVEEVDCYCLSKLCEESERLVMDYDDLDTSGTEEAVRVFVRIRPLNKREIAEKQTIGWNFNETSMLEDTPNGQRVYAYDHCFGPTATNQETYDIVGKPVVLKAMEGYNGTVFTYGQTGSGKTWTMRGNETDPGMMVLCIRDILEWEKNHPDIQFVLKVAYLEVYNEEINDLLGDQGPNSKNLKIVSEDAARGAVIGNLTEEVAKTAEDFMAILRRGEASRAYASTNMNAESSRSHTIYRITCEAKDKTAVAENDDGEGPPGRISYLNLVDLAGSERQKSTKAEGKVLKEGANINKSLLALGAVINKLGESSKKVKSAKPAFIPYRDSKLTRILKQSLGGNTLTSILCAVTPAPMHREETVSTLKFGQLCKSIKNNVKANDGIVDDKTLMKQFRTTINELRAQIEELSAGKYVGGNAMIDSDTALGQAMQQKADLEARIRAMETLLLSKGATASEISTILQSSSSAASSQKSAETEAEIIKLNEKIAEQQKMITKLQRTLGEFQDLEESKAAFEEYEHHVRQEMDEETAKLEEEKLTLQNERYKLLKDRSAIDEKESRIGLLLTNLDEKESKLRQLIANMKEQQDQWSRSVSDLQKREDLVDDWQRNHKQREKKLLEIESLQEKKFQDLNKRESFILEEENRLKNMNKELSEREQRLQIGLSRVTNQETINNQKEESLLQQENQLKKKEQECDIRERELLSRRKELESWDVLLREKDRKISTEMKQLDEREIAIKSIESKNKTQEMENEKKSLELVKQENYYQEMMNKYQSLMIENEEINKDLKDKMNEYDSRMKDCNTREEELKKWEKQLMKLQEYLKHIEQREHKLKIAEQQFIEKETEFYQVKVSQITSRHNSELKSLEDIISKQLKITADFQKDLEAMKHEMAVKMDMIHDLEQTIEQKNQTIDSLKEQMMKVEQGASLNLRNSMLMAATANANEGVTDEKIGSAGGNGTGQGNNNSPLEANSSLNKTNASQSNPFDANKQRNSSLSNSSNPASMGFGSPGDREAMNLHPHSFLAQLAVTRNLLYHVLEKYDALPETNLPSNRRRGMVVEQKKKSHRTSSEESRGERRSRGRSADSSAIYEQSSNEENKEGGLASPHPTEPASTLPQTSSLASLFVGPNPPNPNGIAHAASVRSIGSLLSDNGAGKTRKNAILTPAEAGVVSPPGNLNQGNNAQAVGGKQKENTRASVSTLMNELSLDFQQKVGSNQRLSANSSSQYAMDANQGRVMPRQTSYQSMTSTIASPVGAPMSPHQNAGIVGMKPAPINPNTLNAANHHRSSPLTKQHLTASSPLRGDVTSPHHYPSTGKKAPRTSTTSNPAAKVFGEELSSIVRMGDYDESGVPVTTVNLGLKSKRIVKQVTHPNSFHGYSASPMKYP